MDQKRIGAFIAQCRKEKNLTQMQLAETLGITNQAVLGYMVSVIYFFANVGAAKHLGKFALFQMMKGNYDFVPVMLPAAAVLAAAGILLREQSAR